DRGIEVLRSLNAAAVPSLSDLARLAGAPRVETVAGHSSPTGSFAGTAWRVGNPGRALFDPTASQMSHFAL
ncbi:MAG: hypothetical protein RBT03_03715, partial [Kiritimatiellia bacterium]|nr:hypothetical protein [Kiritimatiellia bacterium]